MLLLKLVRGVERADGVRPLAQVHSQQARFVIGRSAKCDWPIPDRDLALSARHCEILRVGGRQVLRDLSTNGTFVNGSRKRLAGDHLLRHGDHIEFAGYVVEVSRVSDTDAQPALPQVARTRIARRGGDPAAMVGPDWQQSQLDAGRAPSLEMNSGFTRISKPWLDTSDEQVSVFATVPNVRPAFEDTGAASEPAAFSATDPGLDAAVLANEVLQSLAAGLGTSTESLGTRHPGEAALRVGRLLRVALFALHHQLSLQSRQMRELGSHATSNPAGSLVARLQGAPGPQDAVGALLVAGSDAEAMLVRAHGELGLHSQRILAAFETACQRLAQQLDPATLERLAAGGDDPTPPWRTYVTLWQAMGLAKNRSWSEGFIDAAFVHLASSYDETAPAGNEPPSHAAASPAGKMPDAPR